MATKQAAVRVDYGQSQTIYRLRAGSQGTGQILLAIRDRGYGREAIMRELASYAKTLGYTVR